VLQKELLVELEHRVLLQRGASSGVVELRAAPSQIVRPAVSQPVVERAGATLQGCGEPRQLPVRPRRRDAEAGMDQQDEHAAESGKGSRARTISPRPVAKAGLSWRKNGTSNPTPTRSP